MPRKVFISYDHSEDVRRRQLLQAWDANSNFSFEFDNRSPLGAINSSDAPVIQAVLTRKMKEADYLLVIVGRLTHTSDWMGWEIARATQADVKLNWEITTPSSLYSKGTSSHTALPWRTSRVPWRRPPTRTDALLSWRRVPGPPVQRRMFISYDHDENAQFKSLLRAWNANAEFEFVMDETSPARQINSSANPVIRGVLTRKLRAADVLLVIVGEHTDNSEWLRWEIEQARRADVRLAIIVVKLNGRYLSPAALQGAGATRVTGFNQDRILAALRTARRPA